MELAQVVGQVVATARDPKMPQCSLLLVELWDKSGTGIRQVAVDPLGAGAGEWVLLSRGSAARQGAVSGSPVDLCIVGIVDEVVENGNPLYTK